MGVPEEEGLISNLLVSYSVKSFNGWMFVKSWSLFWDFDCLGVTSCDQFKWLHRAEFKNLQASQPPSWWPNYLIWILRRSPDIMAPLSTWLIKISISQGFHASKHFRHSYQVERNLRFLKKMGKVIESDVEDSPVTGGLGLEVGHWFACGKFHSKGTKKKHPKKDQKSGLGRWMPNWKYVHSAPILAYQWWISVEFMVNSHMDLRPTTCLTLFFGSSWLP